MHGEYVRLSSFILLRRGRGRTTFHACSGRLHLAQPPLSYQIQQLERELDVQLFIVPIRYTTVPGLFSHIMEARRQADFTPKVVEQAWLMQTIIGLVGANMGVALVPASVRNLHRVGVIYKPLQDISTEVAMGILWRQGETRPVLQRFL